MICRNDFQKYLIEIIYKLFINIFRKLFKNPERSCYRIYWSIWSCFKRQREKTDNFNLRNFNLNKQKKETLDWWRYARSSSKIYSQILDMSGFLLWLSQLATRPTVLCIISWGRLAPLVGYHSQHSALSFNTKRWHIY